MATHQVHINGQTLEVVSPEGQKAAMALDAFLNYAHGIADSGNASLPEGIAYIKSRGNTVVWVHQTTPRVWNLKWIAPESKRPYGGATYRDVVVSLPYMSVVAVFKVGRNRYPTLTHANECFFHNKPLDNFETDEMLAPGLLNCSLFASPHENMPIGVPGKSAVWICTQYLKPQRPAKGEPANKFMKRSFENLYETLTSTGFNYSSDHHEFSSCFTESTAAIIEAADRVLDGKREKQHDDPRVDAIEAWQQGTAAAPHDFGTSVNWLPTGYTLAEIVERIFRHSGAGAGVQSADDVARIVFNNHAETETKKVSA